MIRKFRKKLGKAKYYVWDNTMWLRNIVSRFIRIKQNRIVMVTFGGTYDCNPKYITEELLKQNQDCEIFWLYKKGTNVDEFPSTIKKVRMHSILEFYILASAKVWIDNAIYFEYYQSIQKKKKQIYINTWHGSLGFKQLDLNKMVNKRWVKGAERASLDVDVCFVNSEFEYRVLREAMFKNACLIFTGHPRNDILLKCDKQKENEVKNKVMNFFGLKEGQKICLVAPTFRDMRKDRNLGIDFKRLKESLEHKFGGEWKIILRRHIKERAFGKGVFEQYSDFLLDGSDYIDMQELLFFSHVGITDYSSWLCDFMLQDKPAFVFAMDEDLYMEERGFYFELTDYPFPICRDTDELCENIVEFNLEQYILHRDGFLKKVGCMEDGKAASRCAEYILQHTK